MGGCCWTLWHVSWGMSNTGGLVGRWGGYRSSAEIDEIATETLGTNLTPAGQCGYLIAINQWIMMSSKRKGLKSSQSSIGQNPI